MNKYFVLHTSKTNLEAGWHYLRIQRSELAAALTRAGTPAKCLKAWHPLMHGRADYIFSLWEADKADDVAAAISTTRLPDYVISDVLPVEEIDWVELAAPILVSAGT